MKRLFGMVATLAIVMGTIFATQAQVQNLGDIIPTEITVNGRGEVMVAPNEFKFTIEINTSTTKGRMTVADGERQIIAALKKLNIDTDDALRLNDLSSVAAKKRNDARTYAIYTLTVNNAELALEVMPAINTLDICSVDLTSIANTEIAKYRSQARVMAVKDAVAKANELAAALGKAEASIKSIKEYTNYSQHYTQPMLMRTSNSIAYDEAGGGSAGPVGFDEIKVQCNVDAEFYAMSK